MKAKLLLLSLLYSTSPAETSYRSFDNKDYQMTVWEGVNVTLLTPATRSYDPQTVAQILNAVDGAYIYYATVTGREPTPFRVHNGRLSIGIVSTTCGAGCGYIGSTGIELTVDTFEVLYEGVRRSAQFDQVVFYELGRNFWFCGPAFAQSGAAKGFYDAASAGYAVFMRFASMRGSNVSGGPFRTWSFAEFERRVTGLIEAFEADPSLTFESTLAANQGIPNSTLGATDLFASMVFRLARDYGGDVFLANFWKELSRRPPPSDKQGSVDNVFIAACVAARRNLTSVFQDRWRWPLSASARGIAAQFLSSAVIHNRRNPKLINMSTRAFVGAGDSALISGFILTGDEPQRVLVRLIGPSLSSYGVQGTLMDPMISIFDGPTKIAENDNWRTTQGNEIIANGLALNDDREAAIVLTLAPKGYTAIGAGKGGSTGIALIEVWELP